jgi:hypothetical protein
VGVNSGLNHRIVAINSSLIIYDCESLHLSVAQNLMPDDNSSPNDVSIVRDSNNLAVGAELSIQFGRGQAKVSVVEIDNGKEEN